MNLKAVVSSQASKWVDPPCVLSVDVLYICIPLPIPINVLKSTPNHMNGRCSHALAGESWQFFAMAFNALPLSPLRYEGVPNRGLQQTNTEQATEMQFLQHEAQKWKDLAEERGRVTVAASELEEKLAEKTRQLEGHNTRANDAEAKVKELGLQVHNLQTDMTQLEEAAGNTSNNEADVTLTNQAERLERELAATTGYSGFS